MGLLDKFLDSMKLGYDDDDDDFFGPEYEEEVEDKKKKSFFKKEKEYDFDDDDDDFRFDRKQKTARASASKVTPMRHSTRKSSGMEVCVIRPTSVEDAREVMETLLSGRTVILNFEGLDVEIAQRISDFTAGAAFSINGSLQMISNYIFLATPTNVDISGDLQDLLNSTFEVPTFKARY